MRRDPRLWLGLAVSVVLLALAARGVRLEELVAALGRVRVGWLAATAATLVVRFWLTAVRWDVLLRPVRQIGRHRLLAVTMVGFMANNLLPARMGELVRAYALGKCEGLPASLAFATIVLERVFDGFTLLAFLVGGFLVLQPRPWLVLSAVGSFAVYLTALAVLVWVRGGGRADPLLRRLPEALRGRTARLLDSFALGLHVLGDARALARAGLLSLALWLVGALTVWTLFEAFDLALPVHAAFVLLAVVAVAVALPSAPGYVGTFQAGTVAALALYAVPESVAFSFSLLYHAVHWVPVTLAGLVYLGVLNLTLAELRTAGVRQP